MPISNSELATQLQETVAGWQSFLSQQLDWLLSQADTVTITDPVTGQELTPQTLHKIVSDYEGILGDNPERIAQIDQLLADSQALLTDLQNLEASFNTQNTTIQGFVTDAQTARDAAQAAAADASAEASAADASAVNAGTSEANAASSETKAQEWAENAEDVEVETGQYSALHHAAKAAQSASGAAASASDADTSASNAAASEQKAQDFANADQGIEVEPGLFSARHWALVAQQNSSGLTDTDSLPEGTTNLYFTSARAIAAIQGDPAWNAADWDTAFSWGDHAAAGYLTSVSETDVTQWEASLTIAQSQVTGLTSALAGKANSSHTHDASDIVSGTINVNRIPNLSAAKITSGTLNVNRIPNLSATKITSGTLNSSRIPNLPTSKITGLDAILLDKADEADTLEAEVRVVGGPISSDMFLTGTFGQMTKSGFVMRCTNTVTRGIGLDHALPVGYQFTMVNTGDDQVDINPETGYTYTWLLSDDSITEPALEGRAGAMVTLVKTASNEWMVTGNLVENSGTTGDGQTAGS